MANDKRIALVLFFAGAAISQTMPADYAAVLKTLGKQGDYKANVLKVNIPRSDLKVTIDGIATPTPFGFGGWLAMTKADGGDDVMMGDLVLLEDEVNPVMSALLDNGLEVTALHNHFFFESPRIFYMHVHGHGKAGDLATRAKPAVDLVGHASAQHQSSVIGGASTVAAGQIDTAQIARIVGHEGEQTGPVYKITIGRDDLTLKEMGAVINARMGLNTWAAFYGSDASAEIAGDIAMLPHEITPVLRALRSHGLNVVAIHNHMTAGEPIIYFLHYWGTGPAETLANGFKAAISQTGKKSARVEPQPQNILFVCEHGAAKSVIAAAHFNRLAVEQGLPYRAIARGAHPDPEVPALVKNGLNGEGLTANPAKPTVVTEADVRQAQRVITFACALPMPKSVADGKLTDWDGVPSVSDNYNAARQAIVDRVEKLLKDLAATQQP
jgi:protein-tyrosine-phosphatase